MKLTSLLIAIASTGIMSVPAQALTLSEAMDEIAGYYCAGSTCSLEISGTRTERVITGHRDAAHGMPIEFGKSSVCFFGNGIAMINVNPKTCVGNSLMLDDGGPVWGTETINTLETIVKELIYNGPTADPEDAWTVNVISDTTVDAP